MVENGYRCKGYNFLLGLLVLFGVGCNSTPTASESLSASYVLMQDTIMEFHIQRQTIARPVMLITYFELEDPYEYNAVEIDQNGKVHIWFGKTNLGHQGLLLGDLAATELQVVADFSYSIPNNLHWDIHDNSQKEYLITVSFGLPQMVRSCFAGECPIELCDILQYSNDATGNQIQLLNPCNSQVP